MKAFYSNGVKPKPGLSIKLNAIKKQEQEQE